MEPWQWMLTFGIPSVITILGVAIAKLTPPLVKLLEARAEAKRQETRELADQRRKFDEGLQQTIDHLRDRGDQQEKDIRECIEDRAKLRQELADMHKSCSEMHAELTELRKKVETPEWPFNSERSDPVTG